MEKTRIWAGLEMSQYVSDMVTPSVLGILMLDIQIRLVAGEGTVGLVERKLLILSGFFSYQQTSMCMHPNLIKKIHNYAVTTLQPVQMGGRTIPQPLGRPVHPTLIAALYYFETSTSTLILHTHA
jgi:hypothetical protein